MQLLVANAAFQQKNYKAAIAAADRLMKGGGTPSQDLLQLVLRSNYELNDSAGTARALDLLLKYYPSADTWQRVLDGYFKAAKRDHDLMALYRLAEDVGVLKEPRQYTDMTQALVIGGFGMEGERVMKQGIAANLFAGEELAPRPAHARGGHAQGDRRKSLVAESCLATRCRQDRCGCRNDRQAVFQRR